MEQTYQTIIKVVMDISLVLSNIEYLAEHDDAERDKKLKIQYRLLEAFTDKLETLSESVQIEEIRALINTTKSHLMTRQYSYQTGQEPSILRH